MIDAERVRAALAERGVVSTVVALASTTSTNDDAKRAGAEGHAAPLVVVADEQTAGRGRSGSAWLAPAGENVLMSVLLRPRLSPRDGARLTLAVGAGVSDVLEALVPGRVAVKWPNDLWVDEKKIAGILVEAQTRGGDLASVVVGVGLNVNTTSFPPEIADVATSLASALGRELDRTLVALELAHSIVAAVDRFSRDGLGPFLATLRERDALLGHETRVGEISGVASGIDDDGRLLLARDDGALVPVVAGHVERGPRAPHRNG